MTPRTRLSLFLTQFLAAGCSLPYLPFGDLDDEACLAVALGDTCPDEATAHDLLVGTRTCESPVREVVATGELLHQENVVYTGYGGEVPYDSASDTGGGEPVTQCCYEAAYRVHPNEGCAVGRPLVIGGRTVSACAVPRADWARSLQPEAGGLSDEARTALARAWEEAGLLEHASIPAFARVTLDLVALGAPPELVARAGAALQDEVAHAEACFALASAYAGRPVGPGRLPVPAGKRPSLRRLAVETFREGCVGETLSVGLAAAQLRHATDPAVREALGRIVGDEGRHAELAWDIVRWAIEAGGSRVKRAVEQEIGRLELPTRPASTHPAGTQLHGLADDDTVVAALRGVLDQVIRPAAADLLAAA